MYMYARALTRRESIFDYVCTLCQHFVSQASALVIKTLYIAEGSCFASVCSSQSGRESREHARACARRHCRGCRTLWRQRRRSVSAIARRHRRRVTLFCLLQKATVTLMATLPCVPVSNGWPRGRRPSGDFLFLSLLSLPLSLGVHYMATTLT